MKADGRDGVVAEIEARAPGRVNLIGDHTDYTGGLVLPMAIDRWTTVRGARDGARVTLRSDGFDEVCDLALDGTDPSPTGWAAYVAGVIAEFAPSTGLRGTVRSTVPIGAGLASSAALEVACGLALGFEGSATELAQRCRRAEHRATGTPTGIMDQLASVSGVPGHALLIDCRSLEVAPVKLCPVEEAEIVVVHSGTTHALAHTAYAERVAECEHAERVIGPLRDASVDDLPAIRDPTVLARARHVITENMRVSAFVDALRLNDPTTMGALMKESHVSLRDNYEVSIPEIDALVDRLINTRGVFGARMTGGGFGGCVVALCRPGSLDAIAMRHDAWIVRAVGGASVGRIPTRRSA